jgi:extracellular elastinolytic metalloproteinase
MKRWALLLALAAVVAAVSTGAGRLTVPATASAAASTPSPIKFLTGPNSGAPLDIAKAYLLAHRVDLRGTNVDVEHLRVSDQYKDADTNTTYIYFQQTANNVNINRAIINLAIAKDGSIITLGDRSVNQPAPEPVAPQTSAAQATATAVADAGGEATDKAELQYVRADDGSLRLAWVVQVTTADGGWQETHVDAHNAEILGATDYGADANEPSTHNVFALPSESPNDGPRTAVSSPADALASPFGWNDTDGLTGPEFTITRGNNVFAYMDASNDNLPDPGSSPDGGPTLNFDFPLDLATQQPTQYRPFAVSNLYYWNNIVHDVLVHAGFSEAAGNFQTKNYGGQGLGGDAVNAEAQDGSGLNNANFNTPPDGQAPRMQMYVWRSAVELNVTAPAAVAGAYTAGSAGFGPPFGAAGLSGTIALAQDAANAAGPATDDACTAITNPADVAGKIAIVRRGTCEFSTKVENVQLAGAIAAIVQNNNGGIAFTLGAGVRAPFVTIPALGISDADGVKMRANLPATASARSLFNDRDSDLDSGVIAHEYGHGWSNRLTGGPAQAGCLQNWANPPTNTIPIDLEQMGEGWSDFLAMTLTAKAADTGATPRGMGTYVSFQQRNGIGIRPTQYSTDMTVNPSTYDTLKTAPNPLTIPHGVGYVWASMVWEVYWNLVDQYGWNPNIYESWDEGGNNLALRLVSDGMKLQPCSPGFVDGRNAILLADQNLTGGKNQCLIWRGFAKRGLGLNAQQGDVARTDDGVQDFTLPTECVTPDIDVAPASLTATQLRGEQSSRTVTVRNTALLGSVNADWTVTEATSDCASPSNVPWLSATPASGSTAPQKSDTVTATLDSTGLAVGTHTAKLCVSSNDPDEATVSIAVTLNVHYDYTQQASPGGENAGRTLPIRFSLDGDEGLAIFAAGFPKVQPCGGGATTPAAGTGPTYDASTNTYQWNWNTDKAWAGTCRTLLIGLKDGTTHSVSVTFR